MTLPTGRTAGVRSVLAATLVLPGLAAVSHSTQAETPPEQGVLAFKQGYYSDGQPGWERVVVRSPQLYLLVPVAGQWSVEASAAGDSVSGATPRMHSFRSGATPYMNDQRRAADVRVTRYFARLALTAGAAYSTEYDYTSHSQSLTARWSSDDNNRTWSIGLATTGDAIDNRNSGGRVTDQRRRTGEALLGLTQVLTMDDIIQLNLTHTRGKGFYDDPYKDFDQRPDRRNTTAAMVRWNHHVERFDASMRSSYRYYRDTFGVKSHTVGWEWVQPVGSWTLAPGLRYYSQGAASFYFDPVLDAQGRPDVLATALHAISLPGSRSADQRLAAFGAVTVSMKLGYTINPETTVDLKLERYRQTAALKWGGGGSPYLEPFKARFAQVGLTRRF